MLSRVLFGKGVGSLTAVQAAELAHTVLTLSGRLDSGGVLDSLRRATGLDRLDVQGGNGAKGGQSLSAGKYIGQDVYVGVEQGTATGSGKAKVEVQVLPHVSVDSSVGADAQSDIGVNWKWDY